MNNWYECKVRYEKMTETGAVKKINESYLIDAYSVTEAEARLTEELVPFVSRGEFIISSIKKERLAELFLSDEETEDKYYRCKVNFISLDEKKGIEKKVPATIIIKSDSIINAANRLEKEFSNSMSNFQVTSIVETNIMDVIQASFDSK